MKRAIVIFVGLSTTNLIFRVRLVFFFFGYLLRITNRLKGIGSGIHHITDHRQVCGLNRPYAIQSVSNDWLSPYWRKVRIDGACINVQQRSQPFIFIPWFIPNHSWNTNWSCVVLCCLFAKPPRITLKTNRPTSDKHRFTNIFLILQAKHMESLPNFATHIVKVNS